MSYNWDGRRGGRGRGKGNWGWRGKGYRMTMNNPYLQNLSWMHPQSNYNYPHSEQHVGQNYYSQKQKPYPSPHHKNFVPPKPPSPLPGTEEYTQRNIQQRSELIKKQLNIDSDTCTTGDLNAALNSEEASSDKLEATTSGDLNNANQIPDAKKSAKQLSKQKTKSEEFDVQEIHDKIIKHISNLSYSKKMNLVNQSNTGYDIAIHEVQKQKRLELSRALRDMSKRSTQNSDDAEVINSIIPDIGIKIEDFPKQIIAELSSTLHTNIEMHLNKLVDPEACFKQAQEILSFEYGNDNANVANESPRNLAENPEPITNPFDFEYFNAPVSKEIEDSNIVDLPPFSSAHFQDFIKSGKNVGSNVQKPYNRQHMQSYVSSSQNTPYSVLNSSAHVNKTFNVNNENFKFGNKSPKLNERKEQDFTSDIDFCLENFDVSKSYLNFASRTDEDRNLLSNISKDLEKSPHIAVRKDLLGESSHEVSTNRERIRTPPIESPGIISPRVYDQSSSDIVKSSTQHSLSAVNEDGGANENSSNKADLENFVEADEFKSSRNTDKSNDESNVESIRRQSDDFPNDIDFCLGNIDVSKSYLTFTSTSDDRLESTEDANLALQINVRKDLLDDGQNEVNEEYQVSLSDIPIPIGKNPEVQELDKSNSPERTITTDNAVAISPIDSEQEQNNEEANIESNEQELTMDNETGDNSTKNLISADHPDVMNQVICGKLAESEGDIHQKKTNLESLSMQESVSVESGVHIKVMKPLSERLQILKVDKIVKNNTKLLSSFSDNLTVSKKKNKKKRQNSSAPRIKSNKVEHANLTDLSCKKEELQCKEELKCKKEVECKKELQCKKEEFHVNDSLVESNALVDDSENTNQQPLPGNQSMLVETSNITEEISHSKEVMAEKQITCSKDNININDSSESSSHELFKPESSTEVLHKRWKSPGEKKMMTDISEFRVEEKVDIGQVLIQKSDPMETTSEINLTKSILEQMEEFNRSMMSISSVVSEENDSNNACYENDDSQKSSKIDDTSKETIANINENTSSMFSIDSQRDQSVISTRLKPQTEISLTSDLKNDNSNDPKEPTFEGNIEKNDAESSNQDAPILHETDPVVRHNMTSTDTEKSTEKDSKGDIKLKIEKMEISTTEVPDKHKESQKDSSKFKDKRSKDKQMSPRSKSRDRHSRSRRSESKEKHVDHAKSKIKESQLAEVKSEFSRSKSKEKQSRSNSKSKPIDTQSSKMIESLLPSNSTEIHKDIRKMKTAAEKKETIIKLATMSTQTDFQLQIKTKNSGTSTENPYQESKEVQVANVMRSVEIQTSPIEITSDNIANKKCLLIEYIKKLKEIDKDISNLMKLKQSIYDEINVESCTLNDFHEETRQQNAECSVKEPEITTTEINDTQITTQRQFTNGKQQGTIKHNRNELEQPLGMVSKSRKRKIETVTAPDKVVKVERTSKKKKHTKVQVKIVNCPKPEESNPNLNTAVITETYPTCADKQIKTADAKPIQNRGPLSIKISLKNLKSSPCRSDSEIEDGANKSFKKSNVKDDKSGRKTKAKIKEDADSKRGSEVISDKPVNAVDQHMQEPIPKIILPIPRVATKKILPEPGVPPTKCVNVRELDFEPIGTSKKQRSSRSSIEKIKKLQIVSATNINKYRDQFSPQVFNRLFVDKCFVLLERYTMEQLEKMMNIIITSSSTNTSTEPNVDSERFNDFKEPNKLSTENESNVLVVLNDSETINVDEPTDTQFSNCTTKIENDAVNSAVAKLTDVSECIAENAKIISIDEESENVSANICEPIRMDVDGASTTCEKVESTNEESNFQFEFKNFTGSILVIKAIDNTVIAAGDGGNLYYFNLLTGLLVDTISLSKKPLTSLCISENNKQIYVGSLNCKMNVVVFDTKEIVDTIKLDEGIQCMELSWGYVFIGTQKGQLVRYDVQRRKIENTLKIYDSSILVIKATQEGVRRVLLLATRNAHVTVRDAMTGLLMRTMESIFYPTVYTILMEKSLVYCGTSHHDILVYTFQDGQLVYKHEATTSRGVVCMEILGNLLFAGCYNGNVFVYNINTKKYLGHMAGPGGLLLSLKIVQEKVIVGTKNNKLKIWNIPQNYLDQV